MRSSSSPGILFLVIAVVGGGFTLERVQVPTVPKWSRIASGALGAVFLGGFFIAALSDDDPPEATPATAASVAPTTSQPPASDAAVELGGLVEIYSLDAAVTGGDIELNEFRVLAPPTHHRRAATGSLSSSRFKRDAGDDHIC